MEASVFESIGVSIAAFAAFIQIRFEVSATLNEHRGVYQHLGDLRQAIG
jgi:hypothetical protein